MAEKAALLHKLSAFTAAEQAYWDDAFGRYPHTGSFSRVSETPPERLVAALGGRVERTWQGDQGMGSCVIGLEDASIHALYEPRPSGLSYTLTFAGRTRERVAELRALANTLLPQLEPPSPELVPIRFWALSPRGPVVRERYIAAPAWEAIRPNYAEETRPVLERLVRVAPPIDGGQLILLRGQPGTGKTYCIRALARAWRKWCDVSYIVDPDEFFEHATYMLSVLLDSDAGVGEPVSAPASPSDRVPEHERWRLLIVEDADELLSVDAKSRTGQAFSRLLNLVEGMVGQGLRVLVLMTTNEMDTRIHPAVKREGRCLSHVEFAEFSPEEARQWLSRYGVAAAVDGRRTLADLYAVARRDATAPIEAASQ